MQRQIRGVRLRHVPYEGFIGNRLAENGSAEDFLPPLNDLQLSLNPREGLLNKSYPLCWIVSGTLKNGLVESLVAPT